MSLLEYDSSNEFKMPNDTHNLSINNKFKKIERAVFDSDLLSIKKDNSVANKTFSNAKGCFLYNKNINYNEQLNEIAAMSTTEIIEAISQLVGLQEKFFYMVLEYSNINKGLQTPKLKTPDIARLIQGKLYTTKSVMAIVIKKGLVYRLKGKSSRYSSFVHFAVSREIKEIGNVFLCDKKSKDQVFSEFINNVKLTLVKCL